MAFLEWFVAVVANIQDSFALTNNGPDSPLADKRDIRAIWLALLRVAIRPVVTLAPPPATRARASTARCRVGIVTTVMDRRGTRQVPARAIARALPLGAIEVGVSIFRLRRSCLRKWRHKGTHCHQKRGHQHHGQDTSQPLLSLHRHSPPSTGISQSSQRTLHHFIRAYHYLLLPFSTSLYQLDERCFHQDSPRLPDTRLTSPMTAKKAPE